MAHTIIKWPLLDQKNVHNSTPCNHSSQFKDLCQTRYFLLLTHEYTRQLLTNFQSNLGCVIFLGQYLLEPFLEHKS